MLRRQFSYFQVIRPAVAVALRLPLCACVALSYPPLTALFSRGTYTGASFSFSAGDAIFSLSRYTSLSGTTPLLFSPAYFHAISTWPKAGIPVHRIFSPSGAHLRLDGFSTLFTCFLHSFIAKLFSSLWVTLTVKFLLSTLLQSFSTRFLGQNRRHRCVRMPRRFFRIVFCSAFCRWVMPPVRSLLGSAPLNLFIYPSFRCVLRASLNHSRYLRISRATLVRRIFPAVR